MKRIKVQVEVDPFEVAAHLERVQRRSLTLHQLGELVTNEELSPNQLKAVQDVVRTINSKTESRFTSYNTNLQADVAKKLGLKP